MAFKRVEYFLVILEERKVRNSIYLLAIGFILSAVSCTGDGDSKAGSPYALREPKWAGQAVRIDLSPYGGEGYALEFSQDCKYICVSWLPSGGGDYEKLPGKTEVFDVSGNVVSKAVDSNGILQGEFVKLFPETAWRSHYADFVKDAGGWGFTPDYAKGFRMVDPREADLLQQVWKGELWQLKPQRKLLWSVDLPPFIERARLKLVDFFDKEDQNYVVISVGGKEGHILSQKDGSLVHTFTLGHIETDKEAKAYKEKFNLTYSDGDPALRFSSYALSVEPSHRLLACGAFWGRRVRVISLDAPFRTVFEANSEDHPCRPRGGVWSVGRVAFAGGNYLIAEYDFAGRGTRLQYYPTDIFEIDSWKRVWSENSSDIRSVCLSPDGKKMAFFRGNVLEIGSFVPQSEGHSSKRPVIQEEEEIQDEELAEITKYLNNEDSAIRAVAVDALTKMQNKGAIPLLRKVIKEDKDMGVRLIAAYGLAYLGEKDGLELLVNTTLKGESEEMRQAAAEHLTFVGEAAVEPLVKELDNEDLYVRLAAAEMLAKIGHSKAFEPLMKVLKDKDWRMRSLAADGMGEIGDERAVSTLVAMLDDEVAHVRASAAQALSKIAPKNATEPIIRVLKNKKEEDSVRFWAAWALLHIADKRALDVLIESLKDRQMSVRHTAAQALGKIGDKKAVEPLIEALRDQDKSVGGRAAAALGEISDKRAVKPLIETLKDPDKNLCEDVAEALSKLTKQGFGTDHEKWQAWYEKNKDK